MAELNPISLQFNIPGARQQLQELKSLLEKQSAEHTALLKKQWDEEKQYGANVGALKAKGLKDIADLETKHASQRETLLKRQFDAESAHAQKLEKYLEGVRVRSTQLADREFTKTTTAHQRELDKQARAEKAHALKLEKYHNMLVKNSLAQGDNQRGFREMIGSAINESGIGGRFSSSISGIATGELTGTASAIAGVTAALSFEVIGAKKAYEAGIELTHQIKQEAIGYQTLGYSIEDARKYAEGNESLLNAEADKFGILTGNLREATGAYLKFGGTTDELKDRLEFIVAIQARTNEGWAESAQKVARLSDPEIAGRLAAQLGFSTQKMKEATTESERYALLQHYLAGEIKGVANTSHDAEGETTRFWNSIHEGLAMLGKNAQGGVADTASKFNDLFEAMGRGSYALKDFFAGDLGSVALDLQGIEHGTEQLTTAKKELSAQEKKQTDDAAAEQVQMQKEAEKIGFLTDEYARLKGVMDSFDTHRSRLNMLVQEKTDFLDNKKNYITSPEYNQRINDAIDAQIVAEDRLLEAHNKNQRKVESTLTSIDHGETKAISKATLENPLKAAQTAFELHGIQMNMTKEQIEIGLLNIQIKYDNLIAEKAKKGSNIQVEYALDAAHAMERIRNIQLEETKKDYDKFLKEENIHFEFLISSETEANKKRLELNRKFVKDASDTEGEALNELVKMYNDAWDKINKDEVEKLLKPQEEARKKYREQEKREAEKDAKETAKKLQSVFDSAGAKVLSDTFKPIEDSLKKDKGLIADLGTELLKLGEKELLDFISKQLFPENKDIADKPEALKNRDKLMKHESVAQAIDSASITISTASLTINESHGGRLSDDASVRVGGEIPPGYLDSLDKGTHFRRPDSEGSITMSPKQVKEIEETAKRKAFQNYVDSKGKKDQGEISGNSYDDAYDRQRFDYQKPGFYKKTANQAIDLISTVSMMSGVGEIGEAGELSAKILAKKFVKEGAEEGGIKAAKAAINTPLVSKEDAKNFGKQGADAFSTGVINSIAKKDKNSLGNALLGSGLSIAASIASGGITKLLGFSEGGVVYAESGFKPKGRDTIPAMLRKNEEVITPEDPRHVFNLGRYGYGNNSGGSFSQIDISAMHSTLKEANSLLRVIANKRNNPLEDRNAQNQGINVRLYGAY